MFPRVCIDRLVLEPSQPLLQKIGKQNQTLEHFPTRSQGVLGIFFFISHFRAVSCLSNQFLTCLEESCSRVGVTVQSLQPTDVWGMFTPFPAPHLQAVCVPLSGSPLAYSHLFTQTLTHSMQYLLNLPLGRCFRPPASHLDLSSNLCGEAGSLGLAAPGQRYSV